MNLFSPEVHLCEIGHRGDVEQDHYTGDGDGFPRVSCPEQCGRKQSQEEDQPDAGPVPGRGVTEHATSAHGNIGCENDQQVEHVAAKHIPDGHVEKAHPHARNGDDQFRQAG